MVAVLGLAMLQLFPSELVAMLQPSLLVPCFLFVASLLLFGAEFVLFAVS